MAFVLIMASPSRRHGAVNDFDDDAVMLATDEYEAFGEISIPDDASFMPAKSDEIATDDPYRVEHGNESDDDMVRLA